MTEVVSQAQDADKAEFTFRIPKELKDNLVAAGKRQNRSASVFIRRFMREYIDGTDPQGNIELAREQLKEYAAGENFSFRLSRKLKDSFIHTTSERGEGSSELLRTYSYAYLNTTEQDDSLITEALYAPYNVGNMNNFTIRVPADLRTWFLLVAEEDEIGRSVLMRDFMCKFLHDMKQEKTDSESGQSTYVSQELCKNDDLGSTVGMTFRVTSALKDEFLAAAKRHGFTGSRLLRNYMYNYVAAAGYL